MDPTSKKKGSKTRPVLRPTPGAPRERNKRKSSQHKPVLAREREARLKLEYFKTKFKNLSFSCELTERTTERTHNNNKERTQKEHRENKRKRTQREHKERTQKEHKERTQN